MFSKNLITGLLAASFLTACTNKEDSTWGASSSPSNSSNDTTELIDNDGDGFLSDEDCDDADSTINPGAEELCDGTDNDCDGDIDEDVTDTFYADVDGDGYGEDKSTAEACEPPSGYGPVGGDCNDSNANINPGEPESCSNPADLNCDGDTEYEDEDGDGWAECDECDDRDADINPDAAEICDGEDNNCDGDIDEGFEVLKTWYADTDGDGYGDVDSTVEGCEQPSGYVLDATDCDDTSAATSPDGIEICDGQDNDCDGTADEEAIDMSTYYADIDGDGFGDLASTAQGCEEPSGYVSDDTDCDDADTAINPDATEVCDDADNDCDGTIDEADAADAATWYADTDADGFGEASSTTVSCDEPSGYVSDDTDCDDTETAINPDADEICDEIDNDCDGDIDDYDTSLTDISTWYRDFDADGFGYADYSVESCDQPSNYVADDTDCDDGNADANPDGEEVCDGADNDCDGDTDEDDATDAATWYADTDTDGYGDADDSTEACDEPSGYVSDDTDCDDDEGAVNPAAEEVCDEIDNNCDGDVDEDTAADASTWYADTDGDTFGDPDADTVSCEAPSGYLADATDCDDTDAAQYPGADEYCNGEDDNCNGNVDEDAAVDVLTWYADADGDTYGEVSAVEIDCEQPSGYVADSDDCDDTDAAVNPAATEVCDSVDNDCDASIDEDDAADAATWYADTDNDGYGDADDSSVSCSPSGYYIADDTDCDDDESAVNPGATELCDSIDNDCDGDIDEDDAADADTWYADTDGDTYGDALDSTEACAEPSGYLADDTDCDDTDSAINPAAAEVCDGADNDCDGDTDEDSADDAATWYADDDSDGFGDALDSTEACAEPSGYLADDTDCDDTDNAINPDADEICDNQDNNCDGDIDEDTAIDAATWYADTDTDGYGDAGDSTEACDEPSGYLADNTDCDDSNNDVNPGETEICNEIDDDCDTLVDDDDGDLDASTGTTWYADSDGDTYGDSAEAVDTCDAPSGYVAADSDCDDGDAAINPAATEVCDGDDNDCDGDTDEDDAADTTTWYGDNDGDGFGSTTFVLTQCDQPSNYVSDDTDCDDLDAAVNPDAEEVCNDVDDDCDGDTDSDATDRLTWYSDSDGDTFGDVDVTTLDCDQPSGYVADDDDCDDLDAAINPDATEVCDGDDNDCDGDIDETSADDVSTWYADTDGDGYGDAAVAVSACEQPSGYVADDTDCDDGAAAVNPAATEICDSIDNDCDTLVDDDDASVDSTTGAIYYADTDGDTYGDSSSPIDSCGLPSGYVSDDSDCDDSDAAINPAATEVCDSIDNDCDSLIDDDDSSLDASTGTVFYADSDGDTYGNSSSTTQTCTLPSGYVSDDTDCDDGAAAVNPAATEVCDSIDNDCDSLIDDDDSSLDSSTGTIWYADTDGDTYGDISSTTQTCTLPGGYVSDDDDCDDGDAAINPAATEVCDSIDNDCDSLVDDDDSSLDASTGTVFYADSDGDTYGDSSSTTQTCTLPSGYVSDDDDCDDGDAAINPAATEVCDGDDNDCDGDIDDDDSSLDSSTGSTFYADSDGDGYGNASSSVETCEEPGSYVSDSTDCDDGDGNINPAATEVCDGDDNDCDSLIDDDDSSLDASTGTTWYADSDGDTYGDISSTTQTCDLPSGYVSDDDDCDDGDATQYPGADEYCNSEDDDCDGTTDEDAVDGSDFYIDDDEDGFGDPSATEWACDGITNNYDCNDADSAEPVMVDISAGSASGAGTIDDPLDAIQDGIDSANECVVVAEGTYSEAIDFSGKDLEVIGVDGPDNTIIDASGLGTPVVTFASGEQGWLEGFTLLSGDGYLESTSSSYACTSITTCTDYYDTYAGGGIYIDGADPTVVNVIIEANYLPTASTTVSGNDTYYVNSFGGGIYISSGTLIADGLAILENEADQGGGVYLDPSSVLTMDASWVIGNGAEDGGGVEVDGGDAQLTNVASIWNMADSDGGGILLIDAALEATNVMWGGDDATTGGGLYASGTSSATVMNSIITESGSAEGVLVGGSASFSGSYNNVYNNAGGDYSGISDPTGSSGNLSTSVGFSAWSDDGTYTNENISLTTSSAMIGAGNPSSTYDNADGTTNDIGALGGPSSDWDDGVPGLN